MLKLIIILVLINVGCATIQDFLFPDVESHSANIAWEKDLKVIINDVAYYGTAVVPQADNYEIKVFPPYTDIDILKWRTCHRGYNVKKAVRYGFWPWSKKQEYFKMDFKPTDIERDRVCTLDIEALSKKRKSMGFATIVFQDLRDRIQLPASIECNGKLKTTVGYSLCQAPFSSIQRITLPAPIFYDERANENCPPLKEIYNGVFEISMPKNQCLYIFKSTTKTDAGENMEHRLITYGYERTPPEEI